MQVVSQRIAKGHFSAHNNLKEVEGTLPCTYQGTFKHDILGCFYPCWIITLESKLILIKNCTVSISFVCNFMEFDTELIYAELGTE